MTELVEIAEVSVRIALAGVFAIAATGKLADPRRTRESLRGFGAGAHLAGPGAVALPAIELAVAVLLIPSATARLGGATALALLGAFSVALIRAGRPDCDCFGALGSGAPIGPLARNAVLAMLAVIVAASQPAVTVSGLLLLATTAVVVVIRRQLNAPSEGAALDAGGNNEPPAAAAPPVMAIGSEAPSFSASTPTGERVRLEDLLLDDSPIALVFSDPSCGACEGLGSRLGRLGNGNGLNLALVTRQVDPDETASVPVLLQEDLNVAEAFGITVVPSAVLIDTAGHIASDPVLGERGIEELVGMTTTEEVLQ